MHHPFTLKKRRRKFTDGWPSGLSLVVMVDLSRWTIKTTNGFYKSMSPENSVVRKFLLLFCHRNSDEYELYKEIIEINNYFLDNIFI